jgi:hypothetical protein
LFSKHGAYMWYAGAMTWTLAQARALWWQKQRLGTWATSKGDLAELLGSAGWLRTLGGADVYLAARARRPAMTRAALDAVVDKGALAVRPAARGCIYLVPPSEVVAVMADGAEAWRKDNSKTLGKLGKTLADVEKLAPAVLAALKKGPLDTAALRKALPDGAMPGFGDAGKKLGLSSPLPLALRLLEFAGKVERTLDAGRLDSERYLWRATTKRPAVADKDATARLAATLEIFLGHAGPTTLAQLASWTGRPQRDVKAALATADAAEIEVDGLGPAWLRTGDVEAGAKVKPPSGIALLAFEDNYLVNHGLAAVTAEKHHGIDTNIWGDPKPQLLGNADHVLSRTIVVDGLIAGFWEVDPAAKVGVWWTFDTLPKPVAKAIGDAVDDTTRFLLEDVGHPRSFTLDTIENVQARADRIKARAKKR